MPTGFTYASFQAAIVTQIPTLVNDPNFTTILPAAIDYAELSISRDVDFLATHGNIALGNATIGTATLAIPAGVVVLESLFYGANNAPVTPASQDFIRTVYAGSANGPPEVFAPVGAASGINWTPAMQVLLAPAPDSAYAITGYGTQREAPLSAAHTSTFISANLPDLFWAASMIFLAGYNRNFGAQSDDPRQALSWEAEYQRLLKGAEIEEARKKFQSQAWGPQQPAPAATPART